MSREMIDALANGDNLSAKRIQERNFTKSGC